MVGRHAEFVIGQPSDGVEGNAALLKWIEQVAKPLALEFDCRALGKQINADVSVSLPSWHGGGAMSAKFHHRPLYGA